MALTPGQKEILRQVGKVAQEQAYWARLAAVLERELAFGGRGLGISLLGGIKHLGADKQQLTFLERELQELHKLFFVNSVKTWNTQEGLFSRAKEMGVSDRLIEKMKKTFYARLSRDQKKLEKDPSALLSHIRKVYFHPEPRSDHYERLRILQELREEREARARGEKNPWEKYPAKAPSASSSEKLNIARSRVKKMRSIREKMRARQKRRK